MQVLLEPSEGVVLGGFLEEVMNLGVRAKVRKRVFKFKRLAGVKVLMWKVYIQCFLPETEEGQRTGIRDRGAAPEPSLAQIRAEFSALS